MNGIKKLGGDDIEMPKRSRQESELICMTFVFFSKDISNISCILFHFRMLLVVNK